MPSTQSVLTLPLSDSLTHALPTRMWFLGTPILIAAAIAAASMVGPAWLPLSLLGAVLGTVLGVELSVILKNSTRAPFEVGGAGIVELPFLISHDQQVFEQYRKHAEALVRVTRHADPILKSLALERISLRTNEIDQLSRGNIVFRDTETWRLAYEQLLRSPGTHRYRSVACIRTTKYWGDEPGRQSVRLNHDLAAAGSIVIERIAIIADDLWPEGNLLPVEPIGRWLQEQHQHGIRIRAARMSLVAAEPDLVLDSGIYGSRAIGIQEIDSDGRTARFTLAFDFKQVLAAEERWERLSLYATAFDDLKR